MDPNDNDTEQSSNDKTSEASPDPAASQQDQNKAKTKPVTEKLIQGLRSWFQPTIAEPTMDRCAVIGPVASGKSALLASLDHCEKIQTHSYSDRFSLHIPYGNNAYTDLAEEFIDTMDTGLDLDGTRELVKEPEFTLTAVALKRMGSIRKGESKSTAFSTMDGGGGLLFGDLVRDVDQQTPEFTEASSRLEQILLDSDTIILCLPFQVSGIGRQRIKDQLHRRIYDYANKKKYPKLKRFVVCLTYYELRGVGLGTRAYPMLATRNAAQREMTEYLTDDIDWILQPLRYLHRALEGEVWLTPVSTFGFVPRNGAPNYTETDGMLLTRAQAEEAVGAQITPEAPYSFEQAMKLWRPFLTLDPFAFITTGVSEGTLLFPLHELVSV